MRSPVAVLACAALIAASAVVWLPTASADCSDLSEQCLSSMAMVCDSMSLTPPPPTVNLYWCNGADIATV